MISRVVRKIYIAILIIALILLLPVSMGLPQQTLDRSLILAFGIDKAGDEFEVSAQVMVPESSQSGYKEKREVKSNKGSTIDKAIASLQLNEGKELAVAHANILVVSESAVGEDINIILDYFIRDKDIGYLTIAITPDSAKELLTISSQATQDKDSLLRLISYNNEYIYGTESTLNKVLFGYYSPSQTSLISRLTLKGEESSGSEGGQSGQSGQQSSQSSEGQGQESSTQSAPKQIANDGSLVILKNGKIITALSPLEYRGFHWLMPTVYSSFIELQNINTDTLNNATVMLDIVNSKDDIEYELTNDNKLLINFHTTLEYQISSVQQDKYISNNYAEYLNDGTKVIESALQTLIDSEVQSALKLSKDYQIDIWNIYDKFYQKYGDKFVKYVELNEGDYLKDLQIIVDIVAKESKI